MGNFVSEGKGDQPLDERKIYSGRNPPAVGCNGNVSERSSGQNFGFLRQRRAKRVDKELIAGVDTPFVEKKTRQDPAAPGPRNKVSVKHFSIVRSDAAEAPKIPTGITIQIRLKSAAPGRLVTRKNTEFWLSANED